MRGVNKVIIVGTLGADPEVRQFSNGGSVANISIATSEQWTDKQTGEKKEATEWHRVSMSNRLGEIAGQYLRKGSQVFIEGSLKTRKYTDGQGVEKYITEIRANSMQMLGGKSAGGQFDGQNNQTGYQNQNNQAVNTFNQGNNQSNNMPTGNNTFNNNQPMQNQAPTQPMQNPQSMAMPNPPADEDIPF